MLDSILALISLYLVGRPQSLIMILWMGVKQKDEKIKIHTKDQP